MPVTSQTLANIANAVPVLDAEARKRAEQARQIQMAGALGQAPTASTTAGAPTARALAQRAATAGVQAQATAELSARQRMLQNLQEVGTQALQAAGGEESVRQGQERLAGQTALTEAGRTAKTEVAGAERAQKVQMTGQEAAEAERLQKLGIETDAKISFMTNKQRQDLSKLGRDVKQQLFDSRLQFERDGVGRKFRNERQMSDWAVSTASSREELMGRMQTIQQAAEKEIIMMKAAAARLEQALKQGFGDEQRELDQASKERMIRAKADLEKEIQAKEARAAAIGNILSGAASGAMAGGSVGGLWGAVAGGVLGAAGGAQANKSSTGSYV